MKWEKPKNMSVKINDTPLSPFLKIGNGPSGICLSYMLSGYRPYLSSEAIHPNTILHSKLEEARHLSIVDQVLFFTCQSFSIFYTETRLIFCYMSIVFLS